MTMSAHSASTSAPLLLTPARDRVMRALWHNRSVRMQLLLAFALIDLVTVLLAGSLAVLRARTQTRIEIAASMRLAELLVSDAANLVHQKVPAEQFLAALPKQLRSLRHVRIDVKDAAGIAVTPAPPEPRARERTPAPAWFAALVAPPVESNMVPVIADGRSIGQVRIIGEPADEIAEVWDNLVAMGSVAVVLNLGMIGVLYVLFGRVLDPLTALAHGLSELGRQSYSVRLARPQARELADIADQFNALARALETAHTQNQKLNRRLITAQDDERRRTALELHDEVGPCLFGLKAYASSIATAAAGLPDKTRQKMLQSSGEILAIIEHLQSINRSMLDRLRPMALGHVPLKEILAQLVHERAQQHAGISFDFAANHLLRSYGDAVDLTLYRCIQESLTNAARHAQAARVSIKLHHDVGAALLELTITDDGRGMPAGTPAGFGIRGMRERVEGLGGHYRITSEGGRGVCVLIAIPLDEPNRRAAKAGSEGDAET
jgi:two-component system, NarL family, sensor histidine kinase UhpB